MKIIDLLNKIANDEEVPYKIKYNGEIYEYVREMKWYLRNDMKCELCNNTKVLNDEVEILGDEDEGKSKVPIELYGLEMLDEDMSHEIAIAKQRYNNGRIRTKINEIIDYLESKGKGNDDE